MRCTQLLKTSYTGAVLDYAKCRAAMYTSCESWNIETSLPRGSNTAAMYLSGSQACVAVLQTLQSPEPEPYCLSDDPVHLQSSGQL